MGILLIFDHRFAFSTVFTGFLFLPNRKFSMNFLLHNTFPKVTAGMRTLLLAMLLLSACEPAVQHPELGEGLFAGIRTKYGTVYVRLAVDKAPLTVANFVGLAEGSISNTFRSSGKPYFDGLTFHRVEKGFVIQGGDPQANGTGGPGYQFRQEIHPDLKHNVAGTLAMANAGPGSNGSQFYLTMAPKPVLDGSYNVFGYVTQGLEYVYKVQRNDTIEAITIIRNGEVAEAFDAPKVFADLR